MTRKRHDVDSEATRAARFEDNRSYVTHSGKEFRFGLDLRSIRECVYDRDRWRCVRCKRKVNLVTMHMHHVISRGRLGDDSLGNLQTLCMPCHQKEHVQVHLHF